MQQAPQPGRQAGEDGDSGMPALSQKPGIRRA